MKKRILALGIVFMISLNCIACEKSENNKAVEVKETIVNSVKESSTCNVSIEPKIELLGVVQYLADDHVIEKEDLNEKNKKYSEDILNYFSKYSNEEVVGLYKEMNGEGFNYHIPPTAMLYVDNNLNLIENLVIPEGILQRSGGKETFFKFLKLLAAFGKKSNFNDFYLSHNKFYNECVSGVKNRIDKLDIISNVQAYYGYKQNSYNFIIQPLSIGGYGAKVSTKDGKYDLYDFMVVPDNDPEFLQMVVHEFGHSYVNSLTEKNIDEVNKYSDLFSSIKYDMAKQAYPAWEYCVNEHIVRAVAYRVVSNTLGSEISQKYIGWDTERKFIYLSAISEKLKEYENNRDKYPTFNDFYPEIIKLFKELYIKQSSK